MFTVSSRGEVSVKPEISYVMVYADDKYQLIGT